MIWLGFVTKSKFALFIKRRQGVESRKITFFKENHFIQKARWLRGCQAQFSSVQSLSHVWLCVTPWTASPQASLSITNTQSSPKPMSTESVIPSNHLILSSPSPPALSHSQNQDLFKWVSSSYQVAKVLEFQLQNQSFQWIFRTDLLWNQIRSDQSLSRVRLFSTPWIAARQASLSITNSQSSLRFTSIESVMPSSHLILCRPLLLLPLIPPSIRVFSNESNLRMR